MDDKIKCECGALIAKKQMYRHIKTKKHLEQANNKTLDLVDNNELEEEEPEQKENEFDAKESDDDQSETNEEPEEVQVKPTMKTKTKSYSNKAHLDIIREKAIMKLKEKKQERLNKENEIKYKAEQYDVLVKSLKQKEEDEKKRKEQDRLKEIEYKSQQYDKMVKQQQRNSAITTLSNEKIIDDVKQQRLMYLMKYLQNPSIY